MPVPRVMKRAIQAPLGAVGLEMRRTNPAPGPQTKRRRDVHATLASHVAAIIEREQVDCVIDVGAHEGETGRRLRETGWTGPIVSFEPVAASFERLSLAAEGDPAWIVHHLALGRVAGTQRINLTTGTTFSSFLEPNATATELWPQWTETTADEEVDVARLDEVLASAVGGFMADRIFLKLDTQGFDLEVLAGCAGILDRVVAIQSELSLQSIYEGAPTYLEALAAFRDAGFAVTGFYPVTRDPSWRIVEYDAVMIRA
jgi:FkbM family methyltransferase